MFLDALFQSIRILDVYSFMLHYFVFQLLILFEKVSIRAYFDFD